MEPTTFWLVAQCLNHLHHHTLHCEALAVLKFKDLGQHCVKLCVFGNISVSRVLNFQSVWAEQKIEYFQSAGSLWCPAICILFSSTA